jgi:DNA-binding CsgD family transcriptional regulator
VPTLTLDDATWLTTTLCTALSATSDPTTQVTRVLEATFARIASIGGFMTLFEIDSGNGRGLRMIRGIDLGLWTPQQRAARDAYFATPRHEDDPYLAAYVQRGMAPGPSAAIRHELVDDRTWYSSEHVREFRKRAGMDSAIYCTVPAIAPASTRARDATPPGVQRGWSVCANRPWDGPAFTASEKDLLFAVFLGTMPLLKGTWSPPATPQQEALGMVPLRLRKVLACLLRGDSEKQVASKLGLSQHTVHTYVKSLYEHFGVRSRSELLVRAMASDGQASPTPAGREAGSA